MAHLERARDQGAVPEQPADGALLELQRLDRAEAHAAARRRTVPWTTNSFSVVITSCVCSHRQTCLSASAAPAASTSAATGVAGHHGSVSATSPTAASATAPVSGRARTAP